MNTLLAWLRARSVFQRILLFSLAAPLTLCLLCGLLTIVLGSAPSGQDGRAPIAQPNEKPDATAAPISLPSPPPSPAPQTSTEDPAAGLPPTAEAPPATSVDSSRSAQMTAQVAEMYSDPVTITATGDQALFELRLPDAISYGSVMARIDLLENAHLNALIAMYTLFHDYPELRGVTARILVADAPIYEVTATHEQAYAFPPGEVDLQANPDAQSLYLAALSARMYRHFDEQFIDPGIASAISSPTSEDFVTELESWSSGVSVTEVIVDGRQARVTLDMSTLIKRVYTTSERESERAQAFIEDHAKMNLVGGIGALIERFPSLDAVELAVVLDGERYAAYYCTRDMFTRIGPETFTSAVTLDDYNRIIGQMVVAE